MLNPMALNIMNIQMTSKYIFHLYLYSKFYMAPQSEPLPISKLPSSVLIIQLPSCPSQKLRGHVYFSFLNTRLLLMHQKTLLVTLKYIIKLSSSFSYPLLLHGTSFNHHLSSNCNILLLESLLLWSSSNSFPTEQPQSSPQNVKDTMSLPRLNSSKDFLLLLEKN